MADPKNDDEQNRSTSKPEQSQPEGPHAREDLMDYDKTPGTGSLPGKPGEESDIGPN